VDFQINLTRYAPAWAPVDRAQVCAHRFGESNAGIYTYSRPSQLKAGVQRPNAGHCSKKDH
jgi:hypothetical protein